MPPCTPSKSYPTSLKLIVFFFTFNDEAGGTKPDQRQAHWIRKEPGAELGIVKNFRGAGKGPPSPAQPPAAARAGAPAPREVRGGQTPQK